MPQEGPDAPDPTPLKIAKSGELSFEGKGLTHSEIAALFAKLRKQGQTRLAVMVEGDVLISEVVPSLAAIARKGEFELLDNEKYRKFDNAGPADVGGSPEFEGALGEYELPVIVSYAASSGDCVVSLGGDTIMSFDRRLLSADELFDSSFNWLDTLVQRAGGVEAILEKTNDAKDIVARIQASSDTPWRCMAGVVYAVQASGWPVVQFEVLDR